MMCLLFCILSCVHDHDIYSFALSLSESRLNLSNDKWVDTLDQDSYTQTILYFQIICTHANKYQYQIPSLVI